MENEVKEYSEFNSGKRGHSFPFLPLLKPTKMKKDGTSTSNVFMFISVIFLAALIVLRFLIGEESLWFKGILYTFFVVLFIYTLWFIKFLFIKKQ